MNRVVLLHGGRIPHYRVPIYGYLGGYLRRHGFDLIVTSNGIQPDNPHEVGFQYQEMPLNVLSIARFIMKRHIDVIILFVDMRNLYLFPTYFLAKALMGRKMIWWGNGRDLAHPNARFKNFAYATEHLLCDSIILYAEHLKTYVRPRFHHKTFVANNTLCITYPGLHPDARQKVLAEYNIVTKKNIICVGRLQKRKRLEQLVAAHSYMKRPDIGLILVGPDTDGIVGEIHGEHIYKLGPIYGAKKFDLVSAADVCCIPGAVGLSIVDAFHCGLPLVTENGEESAEIMYLKNGENGFVVPRDNIQEMAEKLLLLLDNDELRRRFSEKAKQEIAENARIDNLCAGFAAALRYATRPRR